MKDNKIVDSWNKIEPDADAEMRMLDSILARNHSGEAGKEKSADKTRTFNYKRFMPVAACLALAVALVGIFGNDAGWFGGKTLVADLGNGNTLNFCKSGQGIGAGAFAWDIDWGEVIDRDFTDEEKNMLFGEVEFSSGGALFRSVDGAFIHYEGRTVDEIHVNLSAVGHPVTDTIVDGNEEVSEINGVSVTAGYFVTDANSKGIKNIIYFASFEANGTIVYLEHGGAESNSETLRTEISNLIDTLTQNPPNTASVTAQG